MAGLLVPEDKLRELALRAAAAPPGVVPDDVIEEGLRAAGVTPDMRRTTAGRLTYARAVSLWAAELPPFVDTPAMSIDERRAALQDARREWARSLWLVIEKGGKLVNAAEILGWSIMTTRYRSKKVGFQFSSGVHDLIQAPCLGCMKPNPPAALDAQHLCPSCRE